MTGHITTATFVLVAALAIQVPMVPVEAGTVAYAADYGWNGTDDTKALQSAIDSGADVVVVEQQIAPWIVTPITFASNQRVVFRPGVIILAKRGAFLGVNDRLFSAVSQSNLSIIGTKAIWAMHRDDYTAGVPYPVSENRTGLLVSGCTNVTVEGLTIKDCGGDGVYVGGGLNRNVTIKNVTCDNNLRNGLTIERADGLLVEDVTLKNTHGTSPETGVDIEPKSEKSQISNCILRRVHTSGNARGGFYLMLGNLRGVSAKTEITLDECDSTGDGTNGIPTARGALAIETANADPVGGFIAINKMQIRDSVGTGILLNGKPSGGPSIKFRDCKIINPAVGLPTRYPIVFESASKHTKALSGFVLDRVFISDEMDRNPLSFFNGANPDVPIANITGHVTLSHEGTTTEIPLTQDVLTGWLPGYQATDSAEVK